MVLYLDSRADAITFHIRPPSPRGTLPLGHRRDGDLITEFGSANGYDFAFVSRSDPRLVPLLGRLARSST